MTHNQFAGLRAVLAGVVVGGALLQGCSTVQSAVKDHEDREEIAIIESAKLACQRYGYKVETDAFANCVNLNANAARDREAAKKAAFFAGQAKS